MVLVAGNTFPFFGESKYDLLLKYPR
nr:hypothetical protein [Tanacetum cinerariifolium]